MILSLLQHILLPFIAPIRTVATTIVTTLLIALTSAVFTPMALADNAKRYQVEMLLVAYTDEANIEHESWPAFVDAAPLAALTQNITPAAPSAAFREQAKRVSDMNNATVLWQVSWQETIQSKQAAKRHALDRWIIHDNTRIHLQGSFALYLSRYLHFTSDFTLQHSDIRTRKPADGQNLAANQTASKGMVSQEQRDSRDNATDKDAPVLLANGERAIRAAHIQQERRMRSKELHYIDHPMLGTLVRITPLP